MGAAKSENIIGKTQTFVSESVTELKKVNTPTRAEATQACLVTLFIMMFVSVCLFLADLFFGWLMGLLIP